MTNQEQAFMRAYGKCMATAPDHEVEYFFANKDKAQVGDFKQQQFVRDGAMYWGHIEDAWLLWLEAIDFAKEATK